MKRNSQIKYDKGYTLLFAVLVSSLVLAVGISILTISKKEFLLASAARESVYAFYAADGGLECALYADDSNVFDPANVGWLLKPKCKQNLSLISQNSPYVFEIYGGSGTSCAIVTVNKSVTGTVITSKGYNTGWVSDVPNNSGSCSAASSKRVERAIEYSF